MKRSKPNEAAVPQAIAVEMARTSSDEWGALIEGLVVALGRGRKSDYLLGKVVDAGWSLEFAGFAVKWAEGERAIDEATNDGTPVEPVPKHSAWDDFVAQVPLYENDLQEARSRLDRRSLERLWRPWEVVALDTEFRKRLASALNAPTLAGLTDDLRSALSLLQQAGVTRGESKSQQSSYQPIFHESGAIQWFAGWRSQGATVDPFHEQVRINTVGLGPFLDWFAYVDARRWLAGVDKMGPIDITALRDLLAKAEQNVAMGNDSVAVMANFRSEIEPHARVVAVRWLSDHLKISYHGPSPTTAMRCKGARSSFGGNWVLGGIVGSFCGVASGHFSLVVVFALLGALGGLVLTNLLFRAKSYWQHWA